jgi:hypothetical protein
VVEQAQQRHPWHEHSPADQPDGQLASVGGLIGGGTRDAEQLCGLGDRPRQPVLAVEEPGPGDASVLLASWSCIRKLLPGCLTR